MVLHLLGKKSWNVYGSENVARVRRDEAEAAAREEAEEQRLQEADAKRRIALLRGEEAPPPALPDAGPEGSSGPARRSLEQGIPRKRKRLRGEDDTDREIRYAKEDAEAGEKAKEVLKRGESNDDAPLTDHAGHVQLIPAPDEKAIRKAEKNAEAEAEKAKKRKREEDQYTMRFSNAAGFNNGMAQPWYAAADSKASSDQALNLPHVQDKDVWGNEDPRRKERERGRISTNDPFAAMQQAQRQLKQSARDKEMWQRERAAEMKELKRVEESTERRERKHRRRESDENSLEGFSLDAGEEERYGRRRRHRHHHRRRSRSRSRSRDRHKKTRHRSIRD